MKYKNICLSTDLSQHAHFVGKKALSLPFTYDNFVVLHIVETPVMYTHAFAEFNQLLVTLKEQAQESMHAYLTTLGVPLSAGIIEIGTTKNSIIDFIKNHQIDLLILGSHGIGGFSHLIGSTASFVVANSPCDVWMIHVEELSKKELTSSAFTNPAQVYPHELIKKLNTSLAPKEGFGVKQHPVFSGSEKGVKQDIKRGPHLSMRPKGSPTQGPSREDNDKSEP